MNLRGVIAATLIAIGFASCTNHTSTRRECITLDGSTQMPSYKRDYQYARFRIFDIGRIGDESILQPGDRIIRFDFYEKIYSTDSTRGIAGIAYQDVRDPAISDPVEPVRGRFRLIGGEGQDWVLVRDDGGREFPYVKFLEQQTSMQNVVLAYYFQVERNGEVVSFGTAFGDTVKLQMLKSSTPNPSDPFWDVEWKNVYDLGMRNIDYSNFVLDIYEGYPGDEANPANLNRQNGVPYLQILGLDYQDIFGQPEPDNRIDNNPQIIDLDAGILVFPDRHPFDTDVGYSLIYPDITLNPRVPAIYESDNYTELAQKTKYYFRMGVPSRSTTQSVQRVNLIPGSEVITFNGRQLIKGSDYRIDYDIGQVVFMKDELLDPTADVEICYEYGPIGL